MYKKLIKHARKNYKCSGCNEGIPEKTEFFQVGLITPEHKEQRFHTNRLPKENKKAVGKRNRK